MQTNVSAKFKDGSCLEEYVYQINLGEFDPSTHPNFVLKRARAGRNDLYWILDRTRSPQRVARTPDKSHFRLHFAHSTRTISAEGCARTGQIAFSPAFRALNTHDLRRRLRTHQTDRILACISRTRHIRSPQKVARTPEKSHSRRHFAHSTRTISAEGCPRAGQIALSSAYRALDTRDLRRGLCVHPDISHSRLRPAHSTHTICAEDCPRTGPIALWPARRDLIWCFPCSLKRLETAMCVEWNWFGSTPSLLLGDFMPGWATSLIHSRYAACSCFQS